MVLNSATRTVVNRLGPYSAAAAPKPRAISPILGHAISQIEKTFDPRLGKSFDLNWNKLHNDVVKELDGLYLDTSDNIDCMDKFEAGETLRFIKSLPRFAEQYNIEYAVNGRVRTYGEFVTKKHRDYLMNELEWRLRNSPRDPKTEQPVIGLMARNGALSEIGFNQSMDKFHGNPASRMHSPAAQLSLDNLLSIMDYTHPDTGTFNVVVPAGRLQQYGHNHFKQAIAPLSQPLTDGIDRLARDPRFGVCATFHKGLNLSKNKWAQAGLWNSTWHGRFTNGERTYSFGHPISVTKEIDKSFASRSGYDYLATFSNFRAADVSVFNRDEVIIPEDQTAGAIMTNFGTTQVFDQERGKLKDVSTVEFSRANR